MLNKVLYHGKAYEAAEIQQHAFVTSMLDGPGWSASQPNQLPPGRVPVTHGIGKCVRPRASLDDLVKRISPRCSISTTIPQLPNYTSSFCRQVHLSCLQTQDNMNHACLGLFTDNAAGLLLVRTGRIEKALTSQLSLITNRLQIGSTCF